MRRSYLGSHVLHLDAAIVLFGNELHEQRLLTVDLGVDDQIVQGERVVKRHVGLAVKAGLKPEVKCPKHQKGPLILNTDLYQELVVFESDRARVRILLERDHELGNLAMAI